MWAITESAIRDVRESARGRRAIPKRNAISRPASTRAIRGFKLLREVVVSQPNGIEHRGIEDVIPLSPDEIDLRLVGGTPVVLGDG